jgi:predicted nucleotidyltransferase
LGPGSGGRLTPLRAIAGWRSYLCTVWEAARLAAPGAGVYLAGGAAEDRLTVLSDVDIVVLLTHEPSAPEAAALRAAVLEAAEALGLPPYAPVEIHVTGPGGLRRYLARGVIRPVRPGLCP